jgi:MFS family permease
MTGRYGNPAAGVWRNPDFRKLWIGQVISEVGSRITRDGLPLAAVMVLGATPFQMAILSSLSAGAVLLFSLTAGVWVDRVRRRPIMIGADIARALVIGSIPFAAAMGALGMPQLYVVAALAGVLTVLFDVAYQSYVPSLVAREEIVEANSKLTLSSSIAEVLGPGLTGVLIQTLTAPIAILIDAVSFLWSALLVGLVRRPEVAPAALEEPHLRAEIAGGFRTLFGHPVLATLASRAAMAWFFVGFFGPLYVLFAIRELGMGPVSLGAAIAVGGAGNLLGAMLAPRVARRFGLGATFLATAFVWAFAAMLTPIARGPLWVVVPLMMFGQFIGDAAFVIYAVHETSLRQSVSPHHLLGRVNSVMQLLTRGIYPLGALTGGALAGRIGPRGALWVASIGLMVSILWLFRAPVRQLRDEHVGEAIEPAPQR